jgi:RNA polymerase sigma factor (sigma-70 family)
MSERSDAELLEAWAAGDTAASTELLGRHVGALFRFFDRKLDGAADDLVQETLLGCLAGRARIRGEAGFRGYMFGIARNVLYDHLRARHRAAGSLDVEASCLFELGPSPSERMVRKREQRLLLEALRRLPIDTQVLLELYYWQELSGPDLAEMYGLGERALRSRLHRAKQSLHDAMRGLAESTDELGSSLADFESWARALPKDEASSDHS